MNRRIGLALMVLAFVAGCLSKSVPLPIPGVIELDAQTLPITKTLAWDASVVDASHPAPDNYVVTMDGVTIGSPTGTSLQVTFTTPGAHTLAVAAVDIWGSSSATPLVVKVNVPNAPGNERLQ